MSQSPPRCVDSTKGAQNTTDCKLAFHPLADNVFSFRAAAKKPSSVCCHVITECDSNACSARAAHQKDRAQTKYRPHPRQLDSIGMLVRSMPVLAYWLMRSLAQTPLLSPDCTDNDRLRFEPDPGNSGDEETKRDRRTLPDIDLLCVVKAIFDLD